MFTRAVMGLPAARRGPAVRAEAVLEVQALADRRAVSMVGVGRQLEAEREAMGLPAVDREIPGAAPEVAVEAVMRQTTATEAVVTGEMVASS